MIMNFYRNIDRNRVQFDFLVHRDEEVGTNTFEEEILEMGGHIHRLPPMTQQKKFKKELDRFFREVSDYQIVHSHVNAYSYWILESAKKYGVPVRIAHAHTSNDSILRNLFRRELKITEVLKDILQSQLKKRISKVATNKFACGIKAGEWMYGKSADFEVINNAIDVSKFKFDETASRGLKEELGISEKFVVGHVGNFRYEKNHMYLLEIFREFLRLKPDSVLLLAGGGDLKDQIEVKATKLGIDNHLIFLGVRSDIHHVLQSFDLFLFPSVKEGLPVTLIEAQAAGLLCFVSDVVTQEIQITDLVHFVSLKSSAMKWASKMYEALPYVRSDRTEEVVERGYDIISNARTLQEFYEKSFEELHIDRSV